MRKILLYFLLLYSCCTLIIGHALYTHFYKPLGRIDFTTPIEFEKAFDVYVISNREAYIPQETKLEWWPNWMREDHKNYGRVYESGIGAAHFDIHVYKPCEITLRFLGDDAWNSKGRLNPKVRFSSIKINDKEILAEPKTVWHDNAFYYSFPIEPGLVKLDVNWEYPFN